MFNTLLITLREGLEASLIVGILFAYVAKTGRKEAKAAIWSGVGLAIALSLGFGAFLTFTSNALTDRAETLFAGVTSLTAVVLVTWMVFWMQRTARTLSRELHNKLDHAITFGAMGLISTAFLSVAREGLETSLFLYASFKTVGQTWAPLVGLILGLISAVILGILVYRRSVKINLSKFFTYTGIGLLLIAGSVLHMGIADIAEFVGLHYSDSINWLATAIYVGSTLKFYLAPRSVKSDSPVRA